MCMCVFATSLKISFVFLFAAVVVVVGSEVPATGLSYASVNLQSGLSRNPSWTGRSSILAEFGTVQLELFSLSHRTGEKKYFEAVK